MTTDPQATIDAIWRIEAPRILGGLARILHDLDAAQDVAQDALVAALEQWPSEGIPNNPGAWLMTTAKHRAIDRLRRKTRLTRKLSEIGIDAAAREQEVPDYPSALDDDVSDDVLRLIFTACHPVLSSEGRVALTLRLLGGLTTQEIARAYLVPEATIAQRIVRAKKTIANAGVPFDVPRGAERHARLDAVLEVIYLIFNEGYAATSGQAWLRHGLCEEGLRLARVLAGLAPEEPEVHGLAALLELQASRLPVRLSPAGEPVLLLDQDRAKWDRLLISRGLAALARAERLGDGRGIYALQAAIAACHARARKAEQTDWRRIVDLYTTLVEVTGSPVVELNRAVAVSMAFGPAEGLRLVDAIQTTPSLQAYHYVPSVRGDLLHKLGRFAEARVEFERAAALTRNASERALLLARAESPQCVEK